MIEYQLCTQVPMDTVYEAFRTGYSDYILPVRIERDVFEPVFFGREGNSPELSFIALDDGRPAGLVLGGLRVFDGMKTLRCGSLCTSPTHRHMGVGSKLFSMHGQVALDHGCEQMMLEVITKNHNAVSLYEKNGYRTGYTLKYYSHKNVPLPESPLPWPVSACGFAALREYRDRLADCHVNWQNDLPTFAGLEHTVTAIAAYDGDMIIGIVAATAQGRVFFLHVRPEYRHRGLGRRLTQHAAQQLNTQKLAISFTDNAVLEGFLRKAGFEKDSVEQYEMYLPCGLPAQ